MHARFSFLPLGRYAPQWAAADATNAFYGWRELGAELKSKFPNGFAIAPSHQLSAEIIYYTGADFGPSSLAPGQRHRFDVYRDARVVRSYLIDWGQTAFNPSSLGK